MSQTQTSLDLASHLNPEQIAAVTHGEGPQLVLAGAGSGKTRVITWRIAWLVDEAGVDPGRIAAVTFTNKAAAEMRERVENLLGMYPLSTFVGTFHRFALIMLRRWGERVGLRRDFAILDSKDQLDLVKQALATEGLDERSFTPRAVLSAIGSAKNQLLDPAEYEARADNFFTRKAALVYRRYQGLLRGVPGVDFDDMIALAVELLTEDEEVGRKVRDRVRHLLVDEYQDTNHAQLALIKALAGEGGNLTAVGDEDQGIYRWRGAEIENILSFEKSFPGATVRKLERNYRSTQVILDAAGAVVAKNEGRRGKTLWTEESGGEPIELYRAGDEGDEARRVVHTFQGLRDEGHRLSDMAILVRTNAQTRALEEELNRQAVPYVLVGGTRFYDRKEIKDLVAYLRVLRNPRDTFSMGRILNVPPRGIGKTTEELLQRQASELGITLWDVMAQGEVGDMPTRSANALLGFRDLVVELGELAQELPFGRLLEEVIERSGYAEMYEKKADADAETRLENIREFLSAAQEFSESASWNAATDDLLTAFLDHVSLVSDVDQWEADQGVSVMTLHSAKGLEFPVVAITGLEDGLLPHFNAQGSQEDIEEERRLFYVGMTRAERRLFLSCCRRRRIAGRYQDQLESPFLEEIPGELVQVTESPSLFNYPRVSDWADDSSRSVYRFFGDGDGEEGDDDRRRSRGSSSSTAASTSPRRQTSVAGPSAPMKRGQRVTHPTLGEGRVLSLEGTGDQQKVTVYFDRAGKKRLIAKYANLQPAD